MRKLTHEEILSLRLKLEELPNVAPHPISLVLHNIRSLYNVGSIFRTCDAARVKQLILCGYTPHPPRKEIEKTALGAVDTVPWRYFKKIEEALEYLREDKNKIIALEITDNKRRYDTFTKDEFPMAIIIGNELIGIEDRILALCDDAVEIPMYGVKHSLNVSVAAGIILFETVRIFHNLYNNNNSR